MKTHTIHIPKRTVTTTTQPPFSVTFPAQSIRTIPTLGTIHKWLFDYALFINWKDGWLCPFDERTAYQNITCSYGLRKHCSGNGILITEQNSPGLSKHWLKRVICYNWAHHLTMAYWNITTNELIELPDDKQLVCRFILKEITRKTSWYKWFREKQLRTKKPRHRWLTPLRDKNHSKPSIPR
jgi:hypothetical protein